MRILACITTDMLMPMYTDATSHNNVSPTMLALVGTCCVVHANARTANIVGSRLKAYANGATLSANNTQHWTNNVASVCIDPQQCWHLLAGQTFRPIQMDATLLANNTQQCCDLLRPFAWALKKRWTPVQ